MTFLQTCPRCGDLCPPDATVCHCGFGLIVSWRRPQDDVRYRVRKALLAGDLVPGPCAHSDRGNCRLKIEAHHEDYSKPLNVIWLCGWHHRQLHVQRRREAA